MGATAAVLAGLGWFVLVKAPRRDGSRSPSTPTPERVSTPGTLLVPAQRTALAEERSALEIPAPPQEIVQRTLDASQGKARLQQLWPESRPADKVHVAGTLFVPPEWDGARPEFAWSTSDGPLRLHWSHELPHAHGAFAFELDAPPGELALRVAPFDYRTSLTVPALGLTGVVLEVPPPRRLLVRCLDEQSGRELTPDDVRLTSGPDSAALSVEVPWSDALGRWTLLSARDEVELCAQGAAYLGTRITTVIGTQGSEAVLSLRPVCVLRLSLRERDEARAWVARGVPRLVPLEGQQDLPSWSVDRASCTLRKLDPGLYTLELPEFPGFQPVPPLTLHVPLGTSEHEIEVVARP